MTFGFNIRLAIAIIFNLIAIFSDKIFDEKNHKIFKYIFACLGIVLGISLFFS